MIHGLSEETVGKVQSVFRRFPEIQVAILYGSRAKGCAKPGSDIDITLVGDLGDDTLWRVDDALDELLLPYRFSLSAYAALRDEEFIAHIQRVGIPFYRRT